MWTEKRGNKIRYKERFKNPVTDRLVVFSVTYDRDTAANRKAAMTCLRQKADNAFMAHADVSFKDICEIYLSDAKTRLKPSTLSRAAIIIKQLSPLIGDIKMSKLTAGYVRQALAETGKPPITLNVYISRFKAIIRWAYKNDYIKDCSCADKLLNFKNEESKRKLTDKFLERWETDALLKSMKIEHWKLLTAFMLLTGVRSGEAIALNRGDVDAKKRIIAVNKTYDKTNEIITSPKNPSSIRTIHMQPELLSLCRRIKKYNAEMRLVNPDSNSEALFLNYSGNRVRYDSFNHYLKTRSKEVLGREISSHVLRHTAASLWAESGVPLQTISRRLGHQNSSITADIYMHYTKEMENKDAKIMDNITMLGAEWEQTL